MAKHTGRGIAANRYPTDMNQNSEPSQCSIKVKPDGRIDVFAGTPTSATVRRRSSPRSSPRRSACPTTGSPTTTRHRLFAHVYRYVRLAGNLRRGQRLAEGGATGQAEALEARAKEIEMTRRPRDRGRRGDRQGRASEKDARWRGRRRRGHVRLRRADHRYRARSSRTPTSSIWRRDGRSPRPLTISYCPCAAEVEVDDETGEVRVSGSRSATTRPRDQPDAGRGPDRGRRHDGPRTQMLENCYPYYPEVEHRGGSFGPYLAPAMEEMPRSTRSSSRTRPPTARTDQGIGEMANNRNPRHRDRVVRRLGVWTTELPISPERVLRRSRPKRKARRSRATMAEVVFERSSR